MKRDDFVFTIGYHGSAAVVDRSARRRYRRLGTRELLEHARYREAFRSALYNDDQEELREVGEQFAAVAGLETVEPGRLKRLFGVQHVPDNVTRIIAI